MSVCRSFLMIGAVIGATACCAQVKPTAVAPEPQAGKPPAQKAPRAMDPALRAKLLAKTGGIIQSPTSGPKVLFLNAQRRVPAPLIRAPGENLATLFRLPFAHRDQATSEPVAAGLAALADTNVAAVVVIGDSAGYPPLLLAPEARWAVVNVAALAEGGVSGEQLADRVQKETLRAFGMLMGAAHSSQEGCVLRPVLTAADLDALTAKNLGIESLNKILAYTQRLGMRQSRPSTYRKAVEEGWAPAPTNDVQRAIWQELKK